MKRLLDLFLRLRRRLLHLRDHAAAAVPKRTRSDAAHAAGHTVPAPSGPQGSTGGGDDSLDALLDDLAAGADTSRDVLMQDGTLTVRDGCVRVTPPSGRGRHPVIRPGRNVRVFVNGRPVERMQVVTPGDAVRVEAVDQEPRTTVGVHVTKDRMTACVTVVAQPGVRRRVPDCQGAADLTVHAVTEHTTPPSPPTVDQLRRALAEAGVVHGISDAALEEVVRRVESAAGEVRETFPVAFGTPAEPPVDVRVELFFEPAQRVKAEAGDGPVDLLGLYRLSTVEPGRLLAVKHEAREGRPGRTVTGKDILVRKPRPAVLKAGEGARMLEDGRQVVAAAGGRPTLVRGVVTVHPRHMVTGDVNPGTGHVDFHGDVHVTGGVSDSMRVRAGGAVLIGRGVSNARVEADEQVVIGRNIVQSTVVAGARTARLMELRALMCPLASDLDRLVAAVRQVQDHPRWGSAELSHVSVGRILKRLLETKFPGVVERVEGVLRFVGQHSAATWMEAAFVEFTATLHHRLAGLGPVFVRDIGEIAELARRCRDFAGRFDEEQRQGPVADVVARHVHNSEVWASGQIILQRGGCFYSRLWAGTGVTVESGVFRGEAVTVSRGHVTMDQAGSPWGTEVRITILEDGVFKARRVHPGVHVVIGGAGYVFRTGARGVVVRPAGRELEVTAASWAEAGPGAGKRPGEGRGGAAAGTTAADPA